MNKFKKATKRITAVAASAAMISSAVFGSLSSYPSNFVEDGKFVGTVVVGSGVGADDMTAAQAVIEDLKSEFSGDNEKVTITYKSAASGDSVSAIDDKKTLNFGADSAGFAALAETLDLDSTSLLADEDLDNEEYSQELTLGTNNIEFNYRLFTEVDEEEAIDGLYFRNGATFAKYVLDFDATLTGTDIAANNTNTMVGEILTIMGNEFTVVALTGDEMTLIGGANKISLGEGESTSVSVDGKTYEVSVQSVSDDKVLLSVNGQTKSVDEFEVEEIGGVSIAATDLVSSSRDAVKGYAEIVIGGQKVEIESTMNVKINDEDLDDVYPDYEITADWDNTATKLTITYMIDDEVLLKKGDYLEDVLFNAFTLSYDGINNVDYSELIISSDSDSITFDGNLYNGKAIPSEFSLFVDDSTVLVNNDFQLGDEDERIFFSGSDNASVPLTNNLGGTIVDLSFAAGDLTFDLNSTTLDIKDQLFFTQETDKEDMHLYQVASHTDDGVDSEISFEDLIGGSTYADRNADDLESDLESITFTDALTVVTVTLDNLSENTGETVFTAGDAQLYLENELLMNFEAAESGHLIQFGYSSDADAENEGVTLANIINLTYAQKATDFDTDAIVLSVVDSATAGDRFEVEEDSDLEMFVDAYGTRVTIDTDNNDMVKIEVPDEEVYGTVSFNFGAVGSTMTTTVDADMVEDKIAELEEDGYTIVDQKTLSTEAVEFDVAAPVMDSEASVENAIVVGGPAVNAAARELLGIEVYTPDQAGVAAGEGVIQYFEDSNSVLVYGYTKADTVAAVTELNAGGLSGNTVNVQ